MVGRGRRDLGWLNNFEPDDVDIFKAALTGLYKLAAVDLVREQIERQLITTSPNASPANARQSVLPIHPYDIGASGLVIWPNALYENEVYYPLDEKPVTHPRPRALARASSLNPLPIEVLVYQYHDVHWDVWQRFWENEQSLPAHSTARFPFKW